MHLVILHGYLLQGTGSNIYVANIAQAWCRLGHGVTVICQDRQARKLPFVHEYIGPQEQIPHRMPGPGQFRVIVPDINGLLPVYVHDHYEGYLVKTIPEMNAQEINLYIDMTSAALDRVAKQGVDRVLANHAVFGPVIARRALQNLCIPYDVKIHGSAIEYVLAPYPNFMEYAQEGLAGADKVFAGTQYMRNRILQVFSKVMATRSLEGKICIVPPGMDPGIFHLSEDFSGSQDCFLRVLQEKIRKNLGGRKRNEIHIPPALSDDKLHHKLVRAGQAYDQRTPDADLIERWPRLNEQEPVILYVGKFLAAKGVGELLAVAPAVLVEIPQARFVFVGFGSYREHLEGMLYALEQGNYENFVACARAGDFVQAADYQKWFRQLTPPESSRITLTGYLDHTVLGELLSLASLVIVPSKLAEAFGMIAVESMAAGVLPLCNYHSGLREVIDEARVELPELGDKMMLDPDLFFDQLPGKILEALHFLYPNGFADQQLRHQVGKTLRHWAVKKYAWINIGRRLLQNN